MSVNTVNLQAVDADKIGVCLRGRGMPDECFSQILRRGVWRLVEKEDTLSRGRKLGLNPEDTISAKNTTSALRAAHAALFLD